MLNSIELYVKKKKNVVLVQLDIIFSFFKESTVIP